HPANRVVDAVGIFSSKTRYTLETFLKREAADNGIEVYVLIYSALTDETTEQRARRVQDLWIADKFGAIICYARNRNQLSIFPTRRTEETFGKASMQKKLVIIGRRAQRESS